MSGRFIPRAASPFMGTMSLGCCSSSGPAPSGSAGLLAIRLWDPRVPTHPSLSSLSGSCWTSSANRNPRGRRPRADTAHSKRSASWTRPRISLSQPVGYLLRLAEPPWSRSRSLAVQRRQGRQARGEARLPALFTTARADRQNRAGVGLRAAIGVGPDPRDTGAFPTVSFINEGAPAARPIAHEGVAWGGRLVASHFAGIGRDSNPRPSGSENRSPALTLQQLPGLFSA